MPPPNPALQRTRPAAACAGCAKAFSQRAGELSFVLGGGVGGDPILFARGSHYTRQEIHDAFGGSLQSYLPHAKGRVVCACLRSDTNPDAPRVILTGAGQDVRRSAEMLCQQAEPVPTFVKQGPGEWEYVGDYGVERWSSAPDELRRQEHRSGRANLTRVIFMAEAGGEGG